MTNDIEHLFRYSLAIGVSSLEKCLCRFFGHLLFGSFVFFIFVFYTNLIFNHEVELFSNEKLTAVFVYTFSLIQVIISRINSNLISLISSTQCAMFLHNKKLAHFEKKKKMK